MPASGSIPRTRSALILVTLICLLGCKEKKPAPDASLPDRVREATEQALRVGGPPQMRFRGVQVYAQAMPQRMAVCGQLAPFADEPDLFVPFVAIVTMPATADSKAPHYDFDNRIGTSPGEASRVYVAIVQYCYDKGGPAPGPAAGVMPTPPLPDTIADPLPNGGLTIRTLGQSPAAAPSQPLPAGAPPSPDEAPATGTATMRQNGNLHSDPHGPTIRVVPQGTQMHIFAQAPGGWYQVGDTAPWGWIHESLLDRR